MSTTLTAASLADAEALAVELSLAAEDEEDTDSIDTGDRIEMWGYDPDAPADVMRWRVHVQYGRED